MRRCALEAMRAIKPVVAEIGEPARPCGRPRGLIRSARSQRRVTAFQECSGGVNGFRGRCREDPIGNPRRACGRLMRGAHRPSNVGIGPQHDLARAVAQRPAARSASRRIAVRVGNCEPWFSLGKGRRRDENLASESAKLARQHERAPRASRNRRRIVTREEKNAHRCRSGFDDLVAMRRRMRAHGVARVDDQRGRVGEQPVIHMIVVGRNQYGVVAGERGSRPFDRFES